MEYMSLSAQQLTAQLCLNSLVAPAGLAIASNLAVVFQEASALRFGTGRGDVVHYLPLRTTMAARQKKQVQIEGRPVWAEISSSALIHNLRAIRNFVNPPDEKRKTPRKVLSIVKGNGYGHGGPQVAKILEKAGSDWFGVTSASEGIEVRKAGMRKPILVLTSFWPGEEENLLKHNLTPVVHRCEQLAALNRAAAKRAKRDRVSFHLKMDTGMNRLGIATGDVDCFAGQLAKCSHLQLGGVLTHFASSEAF